ncbi:MAG: hypothetical protein IJU11_04960 [Prevotella sp.]|nr:hypothetical protein [Prevotella sp.]
MMEEKQHHSTPHFDQWSKKSTLAALATLGVTAVAAGATAIVKLRQRQRERQAHREQEAAHSLTPEQQMVYNEAVSAFVSLNERIYELRRHREELQPLIHRLTSEGDKPEVSSNHADIQQLAVDIERFLTHQQPFINACLSTVSEEQMTYADCVRGPVGGTIDTTLDEEPTGAVIADGAPVSFVLKLGYFFPGSTIAPLPVKSIILA